jgi:hypothetical protein
MNRKFVNCGLDGETLTFLLSLLFEASYAPETNSLRVAISYASIQTKQQQIEILAYFKVARLVDGVLHISLDKLKAMGVLVQAPHSKEVSALKSVLSGDKTGTVENQKQAEQILEAYDRVREEFYKRRGNHINLPKLCVTKKKILLAGDLATLLEHHEIDDYYAYIYSVFQHYDWQMVPSMNKIVLEENIDYWSGHEGEVYSDIAERAQQKKARKDFEFLSQQTMLSLQPAVEKMKARFASKNAFSLCQDNLHSTLGYHPLSDICKVCPVKEACKKALQQMADIRGAGIVDVVAERTKAHA